MPYFLCKMKSDDATHSTAPDLDQKRESHEWVSFGLCGDKELILADAKPGDRTDPGYIGDDLGKALLNALRDDPLALALAREQITAPWDHGKDEDGNPIVFYDTLGNWLKAGKPKLLGDWVMRSRLYGVRPALDARDLQRIVDHIGKGE